MNDFKSQSKKSIEDFIKFVRPELFSLLGADKIQQVEGEMKEGLLKDWDVDAGIDWWLVDNDRLRGIASRIQWIDNPWKTWTIRRSYPYGCKTEYAKRKEGIENEWIGPYWFIQAYISSNREHLISLAIIKTKDLINLCNENQFRTNTQDGKTFYYVKWEDAKKKNIFIIEKTYENTLPKM
jgi:hypothetical protein